MSETSPTASGKKVCVVTGTRAEYGLLSRIMKQIGLHPALTLQVVACAAHLSEKHGMTIHQILADGFSVDARVPMLAVGDDEHAVALSVGQGVIGFADVFRDLKPELLLILGDRYEILAAAQTALLMNIPIAHIHGGEVTEGAVDEAIRHAITKMATLHFAAAEPYRQRMIQMGEQPDRVFNVGAPGLDVIHHTTLMDKETLQADLDFTWNGPLFLVTYHPVTWGEAAGIEAVHQLFAAIEAFPQAAIIWTAPNADAQGEALHQEIKHWSQNTTAKVKLVTSLGSLRYLSVMQQASLVLGNSSSGIIEAPAMGVATVNIGSRQQGRLRAPSIIDCGESREEIIAAIQQATSEAHQALSQTKPSVYGQGESAELIVEQLAKTDFSALKNKPFYDLDMEDRP